MPSYLVTGAGRGLGLAFTAELVGFADSFIALKPLYKHIILLIANKSLAQE